MVPGSRHGVDAALLSGGISIVWIRGYHMKGSARFFLLSALFLIMVAGPAWGAGFGIYEWGARGQALGGAMTARVDDPSAIVYNPAALSQVDGIQVLTGITFIMPSASVTTKNSFGTGSRTTNADDWVWYAPHMYFSYQISDKFTLGLGTFTRFGLGNSYDQNWWGRYNTFHTTLTTFSINPTLSYKVTDNFSIGIGLEIMRMDVNMQQMLDGTRFIYAAMGTTLGAAYLGALGMPLTTNDPTTYGMDFIQELKGTGYGIGGNIGLHYKINDQWKVGFSYRSRMRTKLHGEAKYKVPTDVQTALAPITAAAPYMWQKTDVSAVITTPDSFSFGIEFKPLENLSIELGAIYTLWSTYEDLTVSYDNASLGVTSATSEKKWNDTIRLMIGIEYWPLEWLALRTGYVFDQSPIEEGYEEYALPANDRHLFSWGVGFKIDDFTIDLAYTYLYVTERHSVDARTDSGVLAGSFQDGDAHMIGVSVGYHF